MGDKNVRSTEVHSREMGRKWRKIVHSVSFYLKRKEKWSGSGEQYRFKESCFISSLQHAFMLIELIKEKRNTDEQEIRKAIVYVYFLSRRNKMTWMHIRRIGIRSKVKLFFD